MGEVSIIELIVYGLVGYTGIVLLIVSAFKELPATKSQSAIRSIWILAPIFCMYMLSSAGASIDFGSSTSTITNLNTTESWSETFNYKITLIQPVWVTLHILFFIMLVLYFIWNMIQLLVKRN